MFLLNHPTLTPASVVAAAALSPTLGLGHRGHGVCNGAHRHACDTLGPGLAAEVIVAAVVSMRRH